MEIWAVGGYSEIGKNMTGVKIGDDVIVFDIGYYMDKIVQLEMEGAEPAKLSEKRLVQAGAVPDDRSFFREWGKNVKAIVTTHAHLDHVGAIPKLSQKYKAPIFMTPFTAEVMNNLIRNDGIQFNGKVIKLNAGQKYRVSDNIELEFVYATHSTPQTVFIAIHTPEGVIMYAVDWKFDEYPTLGRRSDYKRLRQLAKEGVKALICDSTRVNEERRTYSESYVREMFKDILFWTENTKSAIFVTTFASHIARINMLVDMAIDMGREPVILGRSMLNYISAADKIGLTSISKKAKIYSYKKDIKKTLKKIEEEREKYFVICTGGQGEPTSVLRRISKGEHKFNFKHGDQVIFSCSVIPTEVNEANRKVLEQELKRKEVRIFKDVHQSGHAAREDIRDMLLMMQPEHYIPTHGGLTKLASAVELAREEGYQLEKDVHIIQDGQRLVIK